MKLFVTSILAVFAIAFQCLALSQQDRSDVNVGSNGPEFLVADGSSSGTYKAFLDEIQKMSPSMKFTEVKSSGAVENLDLLMNNKVSGAFMHSDVIFFRSQTKDLSRYKTLLALFSEEVHFLALSQSKHISGGNFLGMGKTAKVFNDVSDLRNCKVGAAGGSYVTAQVIRLQANISYDVIQYPSGKDVLVALDKGEIDAAVFVGGAPLPNLADLGQDYKLLPIPEMMRGQLSQVYHPATITYTKMSPDGIPTVAADCLFVGREYKSPKMVTLLAAFRKAFYDSLLDLQETPGIHPKWQEVTKDNHGKWPWMDLAGDAKISETK